jgi:hypothetical protein
MFSVSLKCIETAAKALQSIGYRPSDAEPSYVLADHAPTLVRIGNWTWRGNSFDPEMPLSLELHFCLWNEPVSQTPMPEVRAFWERRSHRELDGLVFPSLSGADQLAYMTLHILRNLFLRAWIIHHVRELAVFLHNHADDDAFWHELEQDSLIENAIDSGDRFLLRARMVQLPSSSHGRARDRYTSRESAELA